MKSSLAFATFALATILTGALTAPRAETQTGTVTVYTARKIVTMDPGWPQATAVAVKDRRILSVERSTTSNPGWTSILIRLIVNSRTASSIPASLKFIPIP